jgi:FdhE protein
MTGITLEALGGDHPEWRPWLALLAPALAAAADPSWNHVVTWQPPISSSDQPALTQAVIEVDRRAAQRWWRTLLEAAVDGPAKSMASIDAIELLDTALSDDVERVTALAASAGAPPAATQAVGGLAVMPVLHACRRRLEPAQWRHGCCPVCGAWPALAEARGLERSRHGRCGRCGSEWALPWLQCSYCGNDDHARLRTLVPETTGESRKVEACGVCLGYVKTVMTLTPAASGDVPVLDLATVDLDVAALSEGYTRPARARTPLQARIVARERRGVLAWVTP